MKKTVLAMSIALFSVTAISHPVIAAEVASKEANAKVEKVKAKHDKDFMSQLDHASFMPKIIMHIKQNKKTLEITQEQMAEINKYHDFHAPKVHRLVKLIKETEGFANKMMLDNLPPRQVAQVGMKTLKMRHALMMLSIECRSFIKSLLTPKQYKAALTSYNDKKAS